METAKSKKTMKVFKTSRTGTTSRTPKVTKMIGGKVDKFDISIKELVNQQKKGFKSSKLELEFEGSNVTYAFVNTLRRASLENVPTYAFQEDAILIEKNTSIFNNNQIKLRISQLVFPQLPNKIAFLEEMYWLNTDYNQLVLGKLGNLHIEEMFRQKTHPLDVENVEMVVNIKNNTSEILEVTTDDANFYINGEDVSKKVQEYYNPAFLIVKLKPTQELSLRTFGILGVGMNNVIWNAAANSYYEDIDVNDPEGDDPHKFRFTIESQGQLPEYEILAKVCHIMKRKLHNLDEFIKSQLPPSSQVYEFSLTNESHTTLNIFGEFLQNNENILFCGVSRPEFLEKTMSLKVCAVDDNLGKYMEQSIHQLIELFDGLKKEFLKMGKLKVYWDESS